MIAQMVAIMERGSGRRWRSLPPVRPGADTLQHTRHPLRRHRDLLVRPAAAA
jgi:hypothetical protein